MSIIFKTEERRVIPRLRSFELALSTGELSLSGKLTTKAISYDKTSFIQNQLEIWKKNKNLSYAGDILGSSFVLGVSDQFEDIAKYILNHSASAADPLARLAQKVLKFDDNLLETDAEIQDLSLIAEVTRHELRTLKQTLKSEPKNPIAWMEIGRLYALEGQITKATQAIEIALALDKDNRFITRSASRFFHHFKSDPERALSVIKNAEFSKKDPWLLSADIAYSQVMNRFSRMIKIGENYVRDHTSETFSITELTSALGTVEYKNGRAKEAKKYFRQALLMPTDNSLAQVNWMAENLNGFQVDTLNYHVPLAYEARAIHYYESGDFKSAYEQTLKWQQDEPFSARPIKAASYILGFFYKDYKTAVDLTRRGLVFNPNDIILENNLVYYLAMDLQIEEATKLFEQSLTKVIQNPEKYTESEQLYCNATAGLILFKSNQHDLGHRYYAKAIEISKKMKNSYLTSLATVNYVKAAISVGIDDQDIEKLMQKLRECCINSPKADIKFLYKEIIEQFNERFKLP